MVVHLGNINCGVWGGGIVVLEFLYFVVGYGLGLMGGKMNWGSL